MTPSALVVQVPAHQHDIYYLYLYIYHISTRLHPEHAAAAAEGGGVGEPRGGAAPATRVQTRGARGSGGACPARPAAAPPPPAARPEQLCGGAAVPDQAVAQAAHPQPQLSGESHDVSQLFIRQYKVAADTNSRQQPVIVCTPQNNVRYVLVFLQCFQFSGKFTSVRTFLPCKLLLPVPCHHASC